MRKTRIRSCCRFIFCRSCSDRVALHLHLFSTPSKYARHGCAYFGILFSADGGAHTPVALGAIGERTNRCFAESSPAPACDVALFRCMCSIEFLADFFVSDVCMRKTRPFGRVFRLAFRVGLSGPRWCASAESSRPFYVLTQTVARIIAWGVKRQLLVMTRFECNIKKLVITSAPHPKEIVYNLVCCDEGIQAP